MDKIITRYEVTYYSLGPFGAEYFLYTEVKQRVAQLMEEAIESSMDTLTTEQYSQLAQGLPIARIAVNSHAALRALQVILAEFRVWFEGPEGGGGGGPLPPIPLSWCSPKVKALAETLMHRYTPTFQGIVFVEQRHIATCLAAILPRIPLLTHIIKSDQLVGHGTGGSQTKAQFKGMAIRNQQDTVKLFRERRLNLCACILGSCRRACADCGIVVATSVAEEGLDFPVRLTSSVWC